MATLTYHGHSTFTIRTDDDVHIVIDPWFEGNPHTELTVDDLEDVDYIFCTHGHEDHFADALPLARKSGATLVSTFEIVMFAGEQGIENVHPMHIGGAFRFPFGRVKMTPALHGGQVHGDESGRWTTVPAGFVFQLGRTRLYHAGDTALINDMRLLDGKVDIALLPIGDNFTMGPDDAVRALEFINPRVVVPIHYNTFPLIEQDTEEFRLKVGNRARVKVMAPGAEMELG
ncbi:MAG: metal-dependent hydrolase [Gemmatimonadales bacterium]|nr:MAG: metal-dependent hydrolase [Gemmatimonadales bacterium]